ncbi:MAG: MOP flippase family protein [Alphaproteobacteria bacterium]
MDANAPEQSAVPVAAAPTPVQSLEGRRSSAFVPGSADSRVARETRGGDLRRLVARGVLWTGAGTIARQVLQLATSLVLARLLTPDSFGIIGMAMVFVGVAEIMVDFGLQQAIVQAPRPRAALFSSCFWLSGGVGIVAALLLCALAPVIAALYQEPQIAALLPFLGLNLFIATLSTVPRALLQREMNFGVLTRLAFVAGLLGATTGCTIAALGGGVWSLIGQPLASSLAGTVMTFAACRWRPDFTFSTTDLSGVIRFGGGVFGAALLNYLNRNADNFLIGFFLGAGALGYYNIAYQMMLLPLAYVSSSLGTVMYPALVQLQDDLTRYKRAYLRTCSAIAFVAFPMMAGLFVVADQFVPVVLGSKWAPATTVLKILCPLGLVQSIATTVGLIYTSTGHTKTLFLWTLGATPFIVLSFAVGLPWGIEGIAISYSVVFYIVAYVSFRIAFRIIGLTIGSLLSALWRPLACALAMAGAVFVLDHVAVAGVLSDLPRLAANVMSGGLIYLMLSLMINRHQLNELMQIGRSAIGAAPDIPEDRRDSGLAPGISR